MSRGGHAAILAILVTAGLGAAPAAHAQAAFRRDAFARPLLAFQVPPRSQHPVTPLTPAQADQVQQARQLLESGQLARAREVLVGLLARTPHHPLVLAELARVEIAGKRWSAVEALARRERAATGDSLLLGVEDVLALERLGRIRDAAEIAVEMWAATPAAGGWAQGTLVRLLPADTHGVVEAVRRASDRLPGRSDLPRTLARLEWQAGDDRAALRTLAEADRGGGSSPLRWSFSEDLLRSGTARDSSGALEALLALAGDTAYQPAYRLTAARRAWGVALSRGDAGAAAVRIARAITDVPRAQWSTDFLVALARSLREGGHLDEARNLVGEGPAGAGAAPAVALERALMDLREGPIDRALPELRALSATSGEAAFRYAEALFYDGRADSAQAWYDRVSSDPSSPFAGRAFERLYLIEDADPRAALPVFGRVAYAEWRGDARQAAALAESLTRALPRGAMWAQASLTLSAQRVTLGDPRGALVPLLAVADSLPGDRLAPLACQRLGDITLEELHDDHRALELYEDCLARYPKAWNAPEVRRRVELLRKRRI